MLKPNFLRKLGQESAVSIGGSLTAENLSEPTEFGIVILVAPVNLVGALGGEGSFHPGSYHLNVIDGFLAVIEIFIDTGPETMLPTVVVAMRI